jgi:hypothetical protein
MSEVSKSEADRERVNPIDEVIRGFKTVEEWQRYCLDAVDFKDILEYRRLLGVLRTFRAVWYMSDEDREGLRSWRGSIRS